MTHPFQGNMEAYMKYPAAHEAELLEILPSPIGQKSFNPRQSFKVEYIQKGPTRATT